MAEPFVVTISHSLGKEEALRRLRPGFTKVAAALPILTVEDETWVGDRLQFRISALSQTATGTMDVGDNVVRVELQLPWLLQRFAENIRASIESRGRILLEDKTRT